MGRLCGLALLVSCLVACTPTTTTTTGGIHLHLIGPWIGDEQASFLAMVKPWEDRTYNKVDYEPSRALSDLLTARIQAGNAPDLAVVAGPARLGDFARAGRLIALDDAVGIHRMTDEYGQNWLKLTTVNHKLMGVFVKASINGLIYFDSTAMAKAGLDFGTPPRTWAELATDADTLASTWHVTPWCIGVESGNASGWPGADWIKDFFLRQAGPVAYEKWAAGQEAWNSTEMRQAWQSFGAIVTSARLTYGGIDYVLRTNYATAFEPMLQTPPGCYFHHQNLLITQAFRSGGAGQKLSAIGFPTIDPRYLGAQVIGGDLLSMFKDSEQARDLIRYLTTAEAQQIWVKRGSALSANKKVSLEAYPDQLSRQAAGALLAADAPEFDVSALQSDAMQTAFFTGVVRYIANPASLASILNNLEKKRKGG